MADEKYDKVAAFEKKIMQLENDLERLRALYDQFFMGIEKREPITFRNRLGRIIRDERPDRDLSTVQRFKFRTLSHKFSTYCALWDRTTRLIEMGTYDKDRTRNPMADHPVLRRRAARMLGPRDRRKLREAEAEAKRRQAEESEAKPAPKTEAMAGTFGSSAADRKLRTLYMDYVRARKATGEPLDGLSYRSFKRTVLKTREKQLESLACDDIQFRVEIRAGRASLVAQPVRVDKADKAPPTDA